MLQSASRGRIIVSSRSAVRRKFSDPGSPMLTSSISWLTLYASETASTGECFWCGRILGHSSDLPAQLSVGHNDER